MPPLPTFMSTSPSRTPKSRATPASATTICMPARCDSTLIAAPPARKFSTICQVTSCGKAETPALAAPWSPAQTSTCGAVMRGDRLCWTRPSCRASSSRRPRAPGGLVLRSILCCSSEASVRSSGTIVKWGKSCLECIRFILLSAARSCPARPNAKQARATGFKKIIGRSSGFRIVLGPRLPRLSPSGIVQASSPVTAAGPPRNQTVFPGGPIPTSSLHRIAADYAASPRLLQ